MTHYLSARDHSLKELHTKLIRKYSSDIVNQVLELAIDKKLVTSPSEMSEKIKVMLDNKKKGYLYIKQYLRQKELPEVPRIEEIEIDKACAIIDQHIAPTEKLNNEQKNKAMRLLNNRGFDQETINKVIYEIY